MKAVTVYCAHAHTFPGKTPFNEPLLTAARKRIFKSQVALYHNLRCIKWF